MTSWDAGFAYLPTVANEIDVKGVDALWRHERGEQIVSAVSGYLRPYESQSPRYAMDMGINGHHRQAVRKEKHTGGGLRSHARETREPCSAIRDGQVFQETQIE